MEKTFKWLAILGRLGTQYADQQLREWKINCSHHMHILIICDHPGITQDKLKSIVCIHPSNVTRALDYLERQGYIRREVMETDKRTYRLYPTKAARELEQHIRRVKADWEAIIEQDMTEEQKETFALLLEQAGKQASDYLYHH